MPRVKLFDEKEILNKAMHLFWKKGYTATSIQDLVSYLGINRASIYDTFGDKEQLFKKSFELYRKTSIDKLAIFFSNYPNVKEGFSTFFDNAIKEAVSDKDKKGCFVVNATTELVPTNDEAFIEILEANRRAVEKLFYEYLQKGKESGQLSSVKDLTHIASLLFTFYNGMRVVSKVRPDKKKLKASVDVVLSLLE
ncbi:TetR family transcriptional regulator [Neptunitalea chrysea]|uniref:TetR family transcriptional regulator n=1 Tax=Neptunitalea chrysea TaxID=1647581 RepID=A0A9W6B4C8_9FLAO|nr:TetR/AcrR family transcriptional regulator [Neptunitalea chrysea]GLB52413.1 TetR family transcriptional regulator [Neptunitalea chrysea]